MGARTADEIFASYKTSVASTNPTADTSKGPLYDLVGQPLAQVLEPTEAQVDTLSQIYSSEFAQTATDPEAQAFLTNWGEAAGGGNPSTVVMYFMKFSRPGVNDIIDVPVGALVSNSDQSLQFITTEAGQILGNLADSYFNPQRRTYEIPLNVQAVANGPQYDLPQGRINNIVTQIPGIDAVENREDASGGVSAETIPAQITRVQDKLLGLAVNTGEGNVTRIKRFNPSLIQAVNVIPSSNRLLFKRISFKPAIDYYILGQTSKTIVQSYTSVVGGETQIALSPTPVFSIDSVSINGTSISNFSLIPDISLATRGSPLAQDKLLLASPLLANDVVLITLTYNSLLNDIQTNLFGDTTIFQTDELARAFNKVPIVFQMTGKALPSHDPNTVQADTLTRLQELFEPGVWQEEFFPDQILQDLQVNVSGLSNPQLIQFHRSTLATSSIETVIFQENEIASYDTNYITVSIKSI